MSPVQYWFILGHTEVFVRRKMARCDTWSNGWLKKAIKSCGQTIVFLNEKEICYGSLERKMCEFCFTKF